MSGYGRDDDGTRPTAMPPVGPDDQATRHVADVGVVAELVASFGPRQGQRKKLALHTTPDQIVVGRGTASDWQIDDDSLSRRHAQFRWNGRELTVEDLGSANGTRVAGRPARHPTPVRAGEVVQLGEVEITLEARAAVTPDAQATRLVAQPALREEDVPSDPGLPALGPAPTVVRPQPAPGPERAGAAVFRPERDFASPEEPTRRWDPLAALVHPPDKALDVGELKEQLGRIWREQRRMVVLAGAAAWVALLLIVWAAFEKPPEAADPFAGVTDEAPVAAPAPKPTVEQLPTPVPEAERPQVLADAIAAYEQGRSDEALAAFRRLALEPGDEAAKAMVDILEAARRRGAP